MVQNFGNLGAHKFYVLSLFRYTLRNTKRFCYSIHLQNRVKKIVKTTLWKHKCDKSSWTVYLLMKKLNELNQHLCQRELSVVWKLLTPFTKQRKAYRGSDLAAEMEKLSSSLNNPHAKLNNNNWEMQLLAKYINRGLESNTLPRNIPNEYKVKLLLPMALHENAMTRLCKIQHQLSKGPPNVVLSHTSAGPSRIWFVRSALNKSRNQSKPLGTLLRHEKKKAQKRLDSLEACKRNAIWAMDEALWEHFLENGTLLKRDLNQHLNETKKIMRKQCISTVPETETNRIYQWLGPVKEVMDALMEKQELKTTYFKSFKENHLIEGGQFGFWTIKSNNMYKRRVARYYELVRTDLPYVVPFINDRDLPSLLNKYKF